MVYTNIYPKNHPNVGKYTIHGAYGIQFTGSFYGCFTCPGRVKTSPTDFPDFVTQDFSYTFGEFPHRTVNVYRRVVDMLWDTYIYIYTVYKDIQSIMGYGMRHTTISDGTWVKMGLWPRKNLDIKQWLRLDMAWTSKIQQFNGYFSPSLLHSIIVSKENTTLPYIRSEKNLQQW